MSGTHTPAPSDGSENDVDPQGNVNTLPMPQVTRVDFDRLQAEVRAGQEEVRAAIRALAEQTNERRAPVVRQRTSMFSAYRPAAPRAQAAPSPAGSHFGLELQSDLNAAGTGGTQRNGTTVAPQSESGASGGGTSTFWSRTKLPPVNIPKITGAKGEDVLAAYRILRDGPLAELMGDELAGALRTYCLLGHAAAAFDPFYTELGGTPLTMDLVGQEFLPLLFSGNFNMRAEFDRLLAEVHYDGRCITYTYALAAVAQRFDGLVPAAYVTERLQSRLGPADLGTSSFLLRLQTVIEEDGSAEPTVQHFMTTAHAVAKAVDSVTEAGAFTPSSSLAGRSKRLPAVAALAPAGMSPDASFALLEDMFDHLVVAAVGPTIECWIQHCPEADKGHSYVNCPAYKDLPESEKAALRKRAMRTARETKARKAAELEAALRASGNCRGGH